MCIAPLSTTLPSLNLSQIGFHQISHLVDIFIGEMVGFENLLRSEKEFHYNLNIRITGSG